MANMVSARGGQTLPTAKYIIPMAINLIHAITIDIFLDFSTKFIFLPVETNVIQKCTNSAGLQKDYRGATVVDDEQWLQVYCQRISHWSTIFEAEKLTFARHL